MGYWPRSSEGGAKPSTDGAWTTSSPSSPRTPSSRDSPRLLVSRAEIRTYYENVPPGTTATVEVLDSRPLAAEALAGFANVTFRTPTPEDPAGTPLAVRLSVVAQHLDGTWRIRQYHVSRVG